MGVQTKLEYNKYLLVFLSSNKMHIFLDYQPGPVITKKTFQNTI